MYIRHVYCTLKYWSNLLPIQICMTCASSYKTLNRLLEIISEDMAKFNVNYVIMSGTLLGQARSREIIRWDHDIDIFIKNRTEFERLRQYWLDSNRLELVQGSEWSSWCLPGSFKSWGFVDIYDQSDLQYDPIQIDLLSNWPGYRCVLNDIVVRCPSREIALLKRLYGPNYLIPDSSHRFEAWAAKTGLHFLLWTKYFCQALF
eukprot:TRINITY_DN8582_c0_g1_i1.p1 TRINITY_DN8582_c0_g1~~TRINITY_DN8582_c0_g1_i1.p1  ORF type:complete len:203 (+),score=2.92 TRINITY_DN8582_c0_g1_i1:357-965(+)